MMEPEDHAEQQALPERGPRYPVGQRLRSRMSGVVFEIVEDWHFHPAVAEQANVRDDRYYVVEGPHGRDVAFHGLLEEQCDELPAEPPAEDGTP